LKKFLILGDCHAPFVNTKVLQAFFDCLKSEHFDVLVQIGDIYDLYSQSRFAKSMDLCTPAEELKEAREWAENFWRNVKNVILAVTNLREIMMQEQKKGLWKKLQSYARSLILKRLGPFPVSIRYTTPDRSLYYIKVKIPSFSSTAIGASLDHTFVSTLCVQCADTLTKEGLCIYRIGEIPYGSSMLDSSQIPKQSQCGTVSKRLTNGHTASALSINMGHVSSPSKVDNEIRR